MLVRPKQSQGLFSIRVWLGNEELSFVEEFRYLGHIMTADCRDDKDIKKQFRRQNAVGHMLVRQFSFAPIEAKIQLTKSYCYPIYGCVLWRHSFQNSIRKLTICYSDTFKRLINVPVQLHRLESSICGERNWPYQCGVPQISYSLMSRVIASPTVLSVPLSIAMHIISLQWWISGRVGYLNRIDHR